MDVNSFVVGLEVGMASVPPSSGGGGAELNIAYGDTPPDDTTKLWVKTNEPEDMQFVPTTGGAGEVTTLGAKLPVGIHDPEAAAVGTKVYLFGGLASSYVDTIYVFDSETQQIEALDTKLPTPEYGIGSAVIGTKVYLFGGHDSSGMLNTISVFDTETQKITTLSTTLPERSYNTPCAVIGTKVYLFGGQSLKTIKVFDTETQKITTLSTTLPANYNNHAVAAFGTKVYLFFGNGNEIWLFDSDTQQTEILGTTLPFALYQSIGAAIGTKLYLFGGYSTSAQKSYDTILAFDMGTQEIETLSAKLPEPNYGMGCAVVGAKAYLLGGGASPKLDTINEFMATIELAENHLLIEASLVKKLFKLLPNVLIGVRGVYKGNENNEGERVEAYLCEDISYTQSVDHYTSSCSQVTSDTSLTAQISCAKGDLVVAAIAARDTLQIGNGWTLVSTSGINSTDTSNGQRLSWAFKFAESDIESITVTQASAQRLYINMVALRGATGVVDNGYSYADEKVSSITVAKPSGLVLWGMTAPLWSNTTPYPSWAASHDMPIVQLDSSVQARLGVGLDQSNVDSVTLAPGTAKSTLIVGSLTVEGMEGFTTTETVTEHKWELI